MIAVLSPAKSLEDNPKQFVTSSQPRLIDKSQLLINKLQKVSVVKLRKLMNISAPLALLNKRRYLDFDPNHSKENSHNAVFTFIGDVYRGLDASSFSDEELLEAQDHIRILSGLYGLLRPLDLIQPYRLEMGTSLPVRRKKNLYDFWGDDLANLLNEDALKSNSQYILNLASDEYWKAVNEKKLTLPVIKANFKEWRNGQYKFLSFNAKKARGLMAQYVVKNKIVDIEGLKGFNLEDYHYNEDLSTEKSLIFTRE